MFLGVNRQPLNESNLKSSLNTIFNPERSSVFQLKLFDIGEKKPTHSCLQYLAFKKLKCQMQPFQG